MGPCQFVTAACGLIELVCYGFTAVPTSLPSSRGEKHFNPKSSWDPDNLGCATSCLESDQTMPFSVFFSVSWYFGCQVSLS